MIKIQKRNKCQLLSVGKSYNVDGGLRIVKENDSYFLINSTSKTIKVKINDLSEDFKKDTKKTLCHLDNVYTQGIHRFTFILENEDIDTQNISHVLNSDFQQNPINIEQNQINISQSNIQPNPQQNPIDMINIKLNPIILQTTLNNNSQSNIQPNPHSINSNNIQLNKNVDYFNPIVNPDKNIQSYNNLNDMSILNYNENQSFMEIEKVKETERKKKALYLLKIREAKFIEKTKIRQEREQMRKQIKIDKIKSLEEFIKVLDNGKMFLKDKALTKYSSHNSNNIIYKCYKKSNPCCSAIVTIHRDSNTIINIIDHEKSCKNQQTYQNELQIIQKNKDFADNLRSAIKKSFNK